jgi:hypothetical protein
MIAYQGKEYITLNDKIYFPGDGSGGKIIKAYYRNNLVYPRTSTIDDIIIDGGGTVTPPLLLRFSNTWNTINSGSGGGDQDSHVILIDYSGNTNIYIYHSHKSVKNGKLDVDNTSGTPSGNALKGGRYPVENVVFKSDYDPNYPVLIDGYYWLIVRAYGTTTGYYYSTISYQDDSVKLNYQLNRSTVPSNNTYVVAVLKVVNHEVSKVYDQADLIRFFNENSSMFRTVKSIISGTSTFVNSTTNYFTRI